MCAVSYGIREVVEELTAKEKVFTALEVRDLVRKKYPLQRTFYLKTAEEVFELFRTGQSGFSGYIAVPVKPPELVEVNGKYGKDHHITVFMPSRGVVGKGRRKGLIEKLW